ncbi:ABC transporter substrate-binding protein [Thermomicrobium sp.]
MSDVLGSGRWTRRDLLKGVGVVGSAVLGSMLLAACRGGEPTPTPSQPAMASPTARTAAMPTPMATPAGPSKYAGETLNLMIIQPHVVAGRIMAEEFKSAYGVTVNVAAVPYDQVQAKATLDVQSGANQFDIFDYWYITVGALARDGILEDLTDFIEKDPEIDPGDFIPSIFDTYTLYEGRRYGLPYDGDTHVLFYNVELFQKYNLRAPTTWEEYLQAAKTITEGEKKSGIYGCAVMGAKVPIIICSSYSNRLGGFGGRYLDDQGRPLLTSPEAIAAAEALLEVAPYALPTPLETAFEQALPAFLQGQAAMMEFWTDLGVYSEDPSQSKVMGKWDVVQMPVGGGNQQPRPSLNAGFAFGVSTGSKKKELAREFIKFATSKEMHRKLLTTTGSGIDPTRRSGLESNEYKTFAPKVQRAAAAALSGAFPWPTIPEAPELMTVLADELALMLQGAKTPQQALADAQAAWERILRS